MLLALGATAVVIVALLLDLAWPKAEECSSAGGPPARGPERLRPLEQPRAPEVVRERRGVGPSSRVHSGVGPPGRSVLGEDAFEAYRALGFLHVYGEPDEDGVPVYGYLIYPHKPIIAYVPQTSRLLNEYCVEFPDETRPYGSALLPESDDVLAKWMALTADERRLVQTANLHLPGRQVDPKQVRRDLWRLTQWERARARQLERA